MHLWSTNLWQLARICLRYVHASELRMYHGQLASGLIFREHSRTEVFVRRERVGRAAQKAQFDHENALMAIRRMGYSYLKPPGVSRTMQAFEEAQALEEAEHTMSDVRDETATVGDNTLHILGAPMPPSSIYPGRALDRDLTTDSTDHHADATFEHDLDASIPDASTAMGSSHWIDHSFGAAQYSMHHARDASYSEERYVQQGFMPESEQYLTCPTANSSEWTTRDSRDSRNRDINHGDFSIYTTS